MVSSWRPRRLHPFAFCRKGPTTNKFQEDIQNLCRCFIVTCAVSSCPAAWRFCRRPRRCRWRRRDGCARESWDCKPTIKMTSLLQDSYQLFLQLNRMGGGVNLCRSENAKTRTYLGKATLAILANKIGTRSHSAPVGRAPVLRIVWHNSEHLGWFLVGCFSEWSK